MLVHNIVALLLCLLFPDAECNTIKEINVLKSRLMQGYDRNTKPISGPEKINVTVLSEILAIGDLDEQAEKLSTKLRFYLLWQDESIIWNTTESNITNLVMDPKLMWQPHIYLVNKHYKALSHNSKTRPTRMLEYYSDGSAWTEQMMIAETSCDVDTTHYPFDQQTCYIEIRVAQINVRIKTSWKDHVARELTPDGSWDVLNAAIDDSHTSVNISITFSRKTAFLLINLIMPISIIGLLTPLVFLLPNESGERVGFSITMLLTISVYMMTIAESLPHKSDPMPLVCILLFITFSLTASVIVIVIINARIHGLPDTVPIPGVLKNIVSFLNRLSACCKRKLMPKDNAISVEGQSQTYVNPTYENAKDQEVPSVSWQDVSWTIDMFYFALMYTVKISLFIGFMISLKTRAMQPQFDNQQHS